MFCFYWFKIKLQNIIIKSNHFNAFKWGGYILFCLQVDEPIQINNDNNNYDYDDDYYYWLLSFIRTISAFVIVSNSQANDFL